MGAARDVDGLGLDDDHGSPASVAVLGDSKWWPPGFRFHPTDEELVLYYLKRKVCGRRLKLPMIGDVDVYKSEPWELPDKSVLKNGDKQWYFFSPRDRKYPKGSRSNRATDFGYWKATGKDRIISQKSKPMGNKKTLVYYHGRAPKGERTDWVMHEYTLDEQMLSSCDNVQDSYALYKVFRKSGPGPKNGEQYGAPFKEEEWDDDEVDESFGLQANVEFPVNQQTFQSSATGPPQDLTSIETPCDAANYLPTDELEDLLLKLSDEQDMAGQHPECSAYISEIDIVHTPVGKRYSGLPLTNASSFEDDSTWCEMSNLEDSFEISERDFSLLEPVGNPEMTSLTYNPQQTLQQPDEEFLEIKDFNEPQSIIWRDNDLINTDQINGPVGLYDSFDYFDAPSAFADNFGPVDLTAQHSYFGEFAGEGILNQSDNIWTELWDHDQGLTNPATTNAFAASQTSGVVHASTSTNLNQVFMASPTSGVAYASISSNIEMIQGQNINAEGTSGSWLSSTLSSFLDSIPSRPALASENAFISRALERVSSFRGGQRFHAPNTATGGQPSTPVRRGGRNGGFLFISFLVGIGAIFWVLTIGASVKLFKGFLARLNSS